MTERLKQCGYDRETEAVCMTERLKQCVYDRD